MSLSQKRAVIAIIFVLIMLIILTGIYIFSITFAGSWKQPDATATYTKNTLSWDKGRTSDGSVKLNIFGDPEEGEDLPTVDPYSKGKYYLRLKNNVAGEINYTVYFYSENEANIPLKFTLTETKDMQAADKSTYPKSLSDYEVLSAYTGKLSGAALKDFEISWNWDTESDMSDTNLGNLAVDEDLLYTFHVMFVIEDNNIYNSDNGGGGGGGFGGKGASKTPELAQPTETPAVTTDIGHDSARMLHRAYIYGYDEGDFQPEGDITRAEVTALFARIISNYDDDSITSTDTPFNDINPEAWYPRYISYLSKTGIINGYTDGSFKPYIPIKRCEFAVICTNYYEKYIENIRPSEISFTDVSKTDWSYNFIAKGYSMGWLNGYPDGSFRGDKYITRAEAVTVINRILNRAADREYIDNNISRITQFTDVKDNTHWAYYEIYEAAFAHIMMHKDGQEQWVD